MKKTTGRALPFVEGYPMKGKQYEMDMRTGCLAGKIMVFALPLVLSGMLQLLFNAARLRRQPR